MRAEDKEIGLSADVEQTRRQDRAHADEELLETGDDRATESERVLEDGKTGHLDRVLQAVQRLFDGAMAPLEDVHDLPHDELTALQFLESAITGRDPAMLRTVYAEDRRDLLEQALAVLYPTLSHAREDVASAFRDQHDRLVTDITGLRTHLAQLDDAQGDVIEMRQYQGLGDDKDDADDADDADEDADDAPDPDPDPDPDPADQPATSATPDAGASPVRKPGDVGDPGVIP